MCFKPIAVALLSVLLAAPVAQSEVTVYGQVKGESVVLEWAFVRWCGTNFCDTTCAYGNWMLMNLPADDSVRLEAWHQGYRSRTCWAKPGTCDFDLEKLPDGTAEQRGDFNLNGAVTAADIVSLISQVFRGLPGPLWPQAADFNCDEQVTAADIIGLVNYVFKAGPAATCGGSGGPLTAPIRPPDGCAGAAELLLPRPHIR
jgi:hypothetical protein